MYFNVLCKMINKNILQKKKLKVYRAFMLALRKPKILKKRSCQKIILVILKVFDTRITVHSYARLMTR